MILEVINLKEYFSDEDELAYDYYKADNLSITIENNTAVIKPFINFTGNRYTFFTANDSESSTISNIFKISVVEGYISANISARNESEIQIMAVINKPVKWVKKVSLEIEKEDAFLKTLSSEEQKIVKAIKKQRDSAVRKVAANFLCIISFHRQSNGAAAKNG